MFMLKSSEIRTSCVTILEDLWLPKIRNKMSIEENWCNNNSEFLEKKDNGISEWNGKWDKEAECTNLYITVFALKEGFKWMEREWIDDKTAESLGLKNRTNKNQFRKLTKQVREL